jgi:hypothetical protein
MFFWHPGTLGFVGANISKNVIITDLMSVPSSRLQTVNRIMVACRSPGIRWKVMLTSYHVSEHTLYAALECDPENVPIIGIPAMKPCNQPESMQHAPMG